jgi:hypothetical protein
MGIFRKRAANHLIPIHPDNSKTKDWAILLEAGQKNYTEIRHPLASKILHSCGRIQSTNSHLVFLSPTLQL